MRRAVEEAAAARRVRTVAASAPAFCIPAELCVDVGCVTVTPSAVFMPKLPYGGALYIFPSEGINPYLQGNRFTTAKGRCPAGQTHAFLKHLPGGVEPPPVPAHTRAYCAGCL